LALFRLCFNFVCRRFPRTWQENLFLLQRKQDWISIPLNILTSTDLHLGLIPSRNQTSHWCFSLDVPFARVSLWCFLRWKKNYAVTSITYDPFLVLTESYTHPTLLFRRLCGGLSFEFMFSIYSLQQTIYFVSSLTHHSSKQINKALLV